MRSGRGTGYWTHCVADNVDFVSSLYAAGSMDKEQLLAALPDLIRQACDPEIEWVEDPERADGRTYWGHDGVLRSFQQWLELHLAGGQNSPTESSFATRRAYKTSVKSVIGSGHIGENFVRQPRSSAGLPTTMELTIGSQTVLIDRSEAPRHRADAGKARHTRVTVRSSNRRVAGVIERRVSLLLPTAGVQPAARRPAHFW
jgi:hypothetical protein